MNIEIINKALSALSIEQLTPLQQRTIDAANDKRDLIVLSPTGSGKTLAYLLPLLLILDEARNTAGIQAMVLVPSRELALQVQSVFSSLKSGFNSVCCYGGHSIQDEKNALESGNPQLIIGTPGRILDHIGRENFNPKTIELLIIDEFDKALELGFQEEMSEIISFLPLLRRRFLLSATDAEEIPKFTGVGRSLKLNYLSENDKLEVRLELMLVNSPLKDKLETLYNLLCVLGQGSSIVFCNHRESVDRVVDYLEKKKITCVGFHGGMEQDSRERSLFRFVNGSANVLVATDLAARGLDIPQVEHIIHYHMPQNEDTFTHRNGRTARWDASGSSYLILHGEETIPEFITQSLTPFEFPNEIPNPVSSEWATLYIGKGRKDKLNVIDIVGYMHKIGKLKKDELGKISVKDHFAFVAVKKNKVNQLLKLTQNEKIKGMKTIIQEAY